jgi:hypothetical protein
VRYRFHDLVLDSGIALPEVPSSRRGARDIEIRTGPAGAPASPLWFHHWREGRRRSLSFARVDDGYLVRAHGMADFHVAASGDAVRCDPHPGCPLPTLRHLLLDQILPLALGLRGSLVLHASGVHVDGLGVVAFAGPAGAGKSSLAAAMGLAGHAIVSDDSLLVRRRGDRPFVVPGYPGARLWRDAARGLGLPLDGGAVAHYTTKRRIDATALPFRVAPARLAAIFVMGQRTAGPPSPSGSNAAARRLGPRDRLVALTRCAYILDVQDRTHLAAMFAHVAWIAGRIPVVRLHVREGRRRLPDAAADVAALARSLGDP